MPKDDDDKQEEKKDWVPIYRKRLPEAIMYAKGSQSMAEFARKCGLNPMTLSRAVNENIQKPLDEKTIRKMAECSELPPEYALDLLMRANGWTKNDDEERQQEFEQRRQEWKDRCEMIQSTIMRTLFEDGHTIMPVFNTPLKETDPTLKESRYHLRTKVGFALRVADCELGFWNFSNYLFSAEDFSGRKEIYQRELRHETFRMLNSLKDLFLRDMWEPEAFENTQYSIVLICRELYDSFFKTVEGITVNNSFSLILIDPDKQKVVEERFLPRRDGKKDKSLFKFTDRGDL